MKTKPAQHAEIVSAIAAQLGYSPDHPPMSVTPAEAAQVLGSTTGTLEVWRSTGRYRIPFIKVGSRVRYPLAGLAEFIAARTATTTQAA